MTMPAMFSLRLLRSIAVDGRRYLPGATLQADAVAAVDLVLAGTARLADDADLPVLAEVARAAAPVRASA